MVKAGGRSATRGDGDSECGSAVDECRDGGTQDAASKDLMAVEWTSVDRKLSGGEVLAGPLPIQVLPEETLEATASLRSIGCDGAGRHTLDESEEVA